MNAEGFDLRDDHIPGEHVNAYLHDFARHYDLVKHMRLKCQVDEAVDIGDEGWDLHFKEGTPGHQTERTMRARKLVVATGLTSEPLMPKFPGQENFKAPIFHTSEFSRANNGLGPYKKVVVFSGAKSSWDVAYAYASAGVPVDWVIRKSGHGPCWMAPNRLTPLKEMPELLVQMRFLTWLNPVIFSDGFEWIRRILHTTWLGRKLVDGFHHKMEHSLIEENGYDKHPETAKLKPWHEFYFVGTNRGLLNYDTDFFELVREGKIRVHIADVDKLEGNTIHFFDGTSLETEVVICGTGWKHTPTLKFSNVLDIGIPSISDFPLREQFEQKADAEIFAKFPALEKQPSHQDVKPIPGTDAQEAQPYYLYRYMVPPAYTQTPKLAFAGIYRSPATISIAQAQALWISAFFLKNIQSLRFAPATNAGNALPAPDGKQATFTGVPDAKAREILYETILHARWNKWRYSNGFGAWFPELLFDAVPYIDKLLKDVGVRWRRKVHWWQEWFSPYRPVDYEGIVEEYIAAKRELL